MNTIEVEPPKKSTGAFQAVQELVIAVKTLKTHDIKQEYIQRSNLLHYLFSPSKEKVI